ncbi:hypothetical protein VL2_gp055 [Pseudomonas phage vB_PaeM_VL12]|uniref:Uncharacterized protein n=5 Tax=Nankokuvirus TaxID=1925779 RepID=A0A6G9LF23_9CAUD|nr:hypothetical protein X832_gp105 [Pseudomonas phage PAK_P5]QIQ63955.1 hypothetical protein Epa24_00150 [Pseudomonas phage Epa24]QIQ64205.1 hypothetical protein Epa17_00007 [Pseudomonas phage Epa17]QIQ65098.1 hypothetical protein 16_00089 [Pseudomonas phage Epa16]QIQ65733.1 hypothetical protein 26_00021 [Pseudomonas phage Epa26]UKH48038.1 MAG: hypothetical protein [Pseudomonas phage RP4]UKM53868.1 hypothetical protein VL2_gp055 [Pseudomonas phage vB_PaeM_VL12]WAB56973.1 hypothetical protein
MSEQEKDELAMVVHQRDMLFAALDSLMRDTGLVTLMRPDQVVRNLCALAEYKCPSQGRQIGGEK